MLEKIKSGAIVVLLLSAIGAFFYGKHLGESQTPPPPALAQTAEKESEKKDEASTAIKALSLKKKTSTSGNKQTGEYKKEVTEDFLFESEDTVTISTDKYREMESIIKASVQPTWGLALGVAKNWGEGQFYSAGYLKSIGKNLYFMGDVGFSKNDTAYKLENGRASVIKLFGGSN